MQDDILISVVVPVYNSVELLPNLISNLRLVIAPRVEIVLVDDGSTDDSVQLLREFATSSRFVSLIENEENQGVAASRNTALKAARGQFVWLADADDSWDPEILTRLSSAIIASGADIAVCRADLRAGTAAPRHVDGLDRDALLSRGAAWELMLRGDLHGYLWNKLFRRESLGSDPFLELSSQSDFTGVVVAMSRSTTIVTIPDVLYTHIVRKGSITQRRNPDLHNLEICTELLISNALLDLGSGNSSALASFFRVWFLCIPAADTPLRLSSDLSHVLHGFGRARSALRGTDLREIRRYSGDIFWRATAIKYGGVVYLAAMFLLRKLRKGESQ
jgi:glycosyltransferase involved in cell wall biosynthesis